MADWRTLCEELVNALDAWQLGGSPLEDEVEQRLILRARTLLARPEPKAGLTDEELFRIASDSDALYIADDRDCDNYSEVVSAMRAAIAADRARYGRPAPVPAGEVGELVADLRMMASQAAEACQFTDAENLSRAADILEQRQAAPVPVASDIRYEFSVFDEDYTEQAGGSAQTCAQALSEGQHYLSQYQQDGPHTLEVRRVEVLPPGAFSVPDDAPVPLLPEGAQVIEPTKHTILVPAPVPVAVSERLPGPEDCDENGDCWFDTGTDVGWMLCDKVFGLRHGSRWWLPATALPLPAGEVQP